MVKRSTLEGESPGRGIPAPPDLIEQRYLWRVLNLAGALMLPVIVAYFIFYWVQQRWALVLVEGGSVLLIGGAWLEARRRRDPMLGLQGMSVASWALLASVIVLHGGLRSPALLWMFMLAPLMVLSGARVARPMAAATILFTLALYAFETAGWLPPAPEVPLLQRAVSACVILILFLFFAFNSLAWRNRIAEQLREARDAALTVNQLKDRFITNLNHELRTPLNAMIGSAQLLARHSAAPEQQRLLEALQSSADHLLVLVNDVLDHSRLESGKVQLEALPFSIAAQLRDVVAMFEPAARAKGLTLALQTEFSGRQRRIGDPTRIRQVLANLVSNAIKFTPAGTVTVRARDEVPGGIAHGLRIEVEDSGPGIAAQERERLFEPFVQADASINRRHGGTGLGLSICRELVLLMQGSIQAEAGAGGGACFVVTLPLPPAPATEAPVEPTRPARPAPEGMPRVLVVEDDAVNRMVAEAMLQSLGARVLGAGGGAEALQLLERETFDLVLMDLQMPGVDGLAACRERRRIERSRGLPATHIVALTGEASEASRLDCNAAGMNGFLTKPIALDDLNVVLQRLQRAP
jgi:signal transduction histidine kinase/CheY-like chemotaxis protein